MNMLIISSAWMICDCSLLCWDCRPLYCEPLVEERLRLSFDYAFKSSAATHPGAAPKLEFRRIGLDPVTILGGLIRPLRLDHGPHFRSWVPHRQYCILHRYELYPEESYDVLAGVEYLILDALRYEPHPTHFHVDAALAAIERIGPSRAYLTHLSHELEYHTMQAKLPDGVELAYDGLSLPLEL